MICGRLPSFIASLPDSVGSCTFIIIRMLALLMFGATDRREGDTSERQGTAAQARRRDATRTASERQKAPVHPNLRPPCNTRQAEPAAKAPGAQPDVAGLLSRMDTSSARAARCECCSQANAQAPRPASTGLCA